MISTTTPGLAGLADRLASHGPQPVERELARLAAHAHRRGVSALLISVLVDPTQPDVARVRAFGRIAVELGAAAAPDRDAPR